MSRPTIFDEPMSPADRMRMYRARKKDTKPKPPRLTLKRYAQMVGGSERWASYLRVFLRQRRIEWDDDIINGRYGKIGMNFLADVCKHGDREMQQLIHDQIKARGAKAARRFWRAIRADMERNEDDHYG